MSLPVIEKSGCMHYCLGIHEWLTEKGRQVTSKSYTCVQWIERHEVWKFELAKVHVDCQRMLVLMIVLFVVKAESDCLFPVQWGKLCKSHKIFDD